MEIYILIGGGLFVLFIVINIFNAFKERKEYYEELKRTTTKLNNTIEQLSVANSKIQKLEKDLNKHLIF